MTRLLALLLMLMPVAATAQEPAGLLYSRTTASIVRHHMPPLPWQGQDAETARSPVAFDVELRDAMTLYKQEGWFQMSSPAEGGGVLLMFAEPVMAPITPRPHYAPLDILMVDAEGRIVKILPSLVLNDLEQEIQPDGPVLAFLFLKGGACARQSIKPGDEVQHPLFRKPPPALSAPSVVKPAPVDAPLKE